MTAWVARVAVLTAIGLVAVAGISLAMRPRNSVAVHLADADDAGQVRLGGRIYAERCAACHGRRLQGQPLWQAVDQDSWRRAPALDKTGHAWLRADDDLFRMTKFGRFTSASPSRSGMPAFGPGLGDADILAVVAFIKANWPIGLRVLQAGFNPGSAGMPRDAARSAWRFPPMCPSGV